MSNPKLKIGDRILFIKYYIRQPYTPGSVFIIEAIKHGILVLDNGTCWISESYENDMFKRADLDIFNNLGD